MARPLSRQLLAVLAGLVLLGSVVACGGSAGSGLVPAGSGGASSSSSSGAPSVSAANSGHSDEDCDGRKASSSNKSSHDDDGCTPAPTASPTSGGGSTTITTYQTIRPLALYSGSNVIDFLVTPVSVAPTFIPLNTGVQKTDQFTVPMTCAVPAATPQPLAADKRGAAVTASATPPPTPTPTNLPVSNCLIVAYAGTSTTAIPVTGPASIDGANLIFPATSPGVNYTIGVSYTFYVAIATTTVVPGGPSPSPAPCAKKNDKGHGNGHDGDRREDDNGNHKDCGHHYGDDDDGDGGHSH